MRKGFLLILLWMAASMTMAQTEEVLFSKPGGFYPEPFELSLDCYYPDHYIRYTTNGSTPTHLSPLYKSPLILNGQLFSSSNIFTIQVAPNDLMYYPDEVQRCVIIRAAVFDGNDSCISAIATNSYIIQSLGNDTHGLPVISICADSLDLFDYHRGIFVPGAHFDPSNPEWSGNYYQRGKAWERAVNVEFYELDNTGINQPAGLRIHGGNGRRHQHKNLAIYAREEYGKKKFKHQFFKELNINNFKHLQLKPFRSSWIPAGVQDALCQTIASQSLNLESLATRPAILYLNGEYWGIYFIHEKPDEHYLEEHFDIDPDNSSIMGNWMRLVEHGQGQEFIEMMNSLEHADLTDPLEYNRVADFFDLDSFIDYQILEMFLGNTDWPANNMRCWQGNAGKWRWIFYDGDACLKSPNFDVFKNATYFGDKTWPTCSSATLLFRRLLANESFRNKFFSRFSELLDTKFNYAVTHQAFDHLCNILWEEIPSQIERFNYPKSMEEWLSSCQQVNQFLEERSQTLTTRLEKFMQSNIWAFNEWLCYPNPSNGCYFFSFQTDHDATVSITVHDLTGKCLYTTSKETHSGYNLMSIDLSTLRKGVYLLQVEGQMQRIVKI